jgi:hypothetical protein
MRESMDSLVKNPSAGPRGRGRQSRQSRRYFQQHALGPTRELTGPWPG